MDIIFLAVLVVMLVVALPWWLVRRSLRADRTINAGPANPRTNPLSITALVLGLVAGPLATPFGHLARAQIRRTGEQGRGMALAGLVLGYLSLTTITAAVILIASA
ncbi:DUF4190 domain-containing protein [Nocardia fluminea]